MTKLRTWLATYCLNKALDLYNQHQHDTALYWFSWAKRFYAPIATDPCFATYFGFTLFKLQHFSAAQSAMETALFLLRRMSDQNLAQALTRELLWKLSKMGEQMEAPIPKNSTMASSSQSPNG